MKELSENEAPIAFVIKSHSWSEMDFTPIDIEIRLYNGNLYQIKKCSEVLSGGKGNMPIEHLQYDLRAGDSYCLENPKYDNKSSIIVSSNFEDLKKESYNKANKIFILNGCVWRQCGEPRYVVNTFGLGHNHGGSGMFVEQSYNGNISKNNYFTALQRKEAIEYADKIASARGDTNDVGKFYDTDNIIVLLPEAVKCNPLVGAGDGDPFINSVESMINKTDSAEEAKVLTMVMTLKGI